MIHRGPACPQPHQGEQGKALSKHEGTRGVFLADAISAVTPPSLSARLQRSVHFHRIWCVSSRHPVSVPKAKAVDAAEGIMWRMQRPHHPTWEAVLRGPA